MAGLVGAYGSDSDDEVSDSKGSVRSSSSRNSRSRTEQGNDKVWMECFDNSTGYPYYWNTKTNEVRWEKPADFNDKTSKSSTRRESSRSQANSSKYYSTREHESRNSNSKISPISAYPPPESEAEKAAKEKKRSKQEKGTKPPVYYGPILPEPKPEEVAKMKILKLEQDLAKNVMRDIEAEVPLDWVDSSIPRALHVKPYKWDKKMDILPIWKDLLKEKSQKTKKAANSIALIAGEYGDTDTEEDETHVSSSSGSKRKMQIQMKSKPKKMCTNVKVPKAFQEDDSNGNECDEEESRSGEAIRTDKRGRKIYDSSLPPKFKKSVEEVAEDLCERLESLGVGKIEVPALKILAIQVETLFAAWECSALTSPYMQKMLGQFNDRLSKIEKEDLAPPGWRVSWDRSSKRYCYENMLTGDIQFERPQSMDSSDEEEGEKDANSNNSNKPSDQTAEGDAESKSTSPPAQPPPPPPPSAPPPEQPPPPPSPHGVMDMDIEEDDEEEEACSSSAAIVHEMQANSNDIATKVSSEQPNVSKELEDFYASLGEDFSNTPSATPPLPASPSGSGNQSPAAYQNQPEEDKKRKKGKFSSNLAIKKKDIGNMVAKWSNINDT